MNRAERRLKEKQARKRNKGQTFSDESVGFEDPNVWTAFNGPVKEEPKEESVPGINCPPINEEFTKKIQSNVWHDREEFDSVVNTLKELSDENNEDNHWSWARNTECKYIDIRIDMRDGGFIFMDRTGQRINLDQLKWQYKSLEKK